MKSKKLLIIIGCISTIIGIGIGIIIGKLEINEDKISSIDKTFLDENEIPKIDIELVKSKYSDFVKLKSGSNLYVYIDNEYKIASTINGEIEIKLDKSYEIVNEYFKVSDSNYYVKYTDFYSIGSLSNIKGEYKYYKNYIVYNENVLLNNNSKLFIDDSNNNYFIVNSGSYPIIIKDDNRYGIEYANRLVYVNKEDVTEIIENKNTENSYTNGISVLNYHYTVSSKNENGELNECKQSICGTDKQLDEQMNYLSRNNYYAVSLRDLELFIEGKIKLPKKSVCLTFDDGWYMTRAIDILEKYQMLGTLFLIGNLANKNDYKSEYLEIHSHTWNMHGLKNGDDCINSNTRGGITCFDRNTILDDLKKSRESLDNTTYFCYPFYDYNEKAINLLKEAGFTMAFSGSTTNNKVRVGQDKYRIPRYVMYNYTTLNTFISYVNNT